LSKRAILPVAEGKQVEDGEAAIKNEGVSTAAVIAAANGGLRRRSAARALLNLAVP
jgi:hypothetical protein